MQIEPRPVADLAPYARNSRTHSEAQVQQIAASIREFGWTQPVLADAESIVVGHGRVLGAALLYSLGETIYALPGPPRDGRPGGAPLPAGSVPVIDCTGWSEDQRRAYVIADNQIALNAGWDADLLRLEVLDLGDDFDLDLLGFGENLQNVLLERLDGENDPAAHWDGMPSFENQDKTAFRILPVHFKDQEAVDAFAKLVGQKITDKTRSLWFPEIEIETYADKRYVAE